MPVEKDVLSATEIISSEHGGTPDWGKYVDALQVETMDIIRVLDVSDTDLYLCNDMKKERILC